jgi:hypothetical protein
MGGWSVKDRLPQDEVVERAMDGSVLRVFYRPSPHSYPVNLAMIYLKPLFL